MNAAICAAETNMAIALIINGRTYALKTASFSRSSGMQIETQHYTQTEKVK